MARGIDDREGDGSGIFGVGSSVSYRRVMRRHRVLIFAAVAAATLVAGCGTAVGGNAVAAGNLPNTVPSSQSGPADTTSSDTPTGSADTSADGSPESSADPTSSASADPETSESTAESSPASSDDSSAPTASSGPKKKWKLPDTKPGRPKNPYGDLIAKPGDANGVTFQVSGKPAGELIFVIDKVTLDPKCAAGAPQPHRGHFLRIDLRVEPRDISDAGAELWSAGFRPNSWTAFDAKGTAQPGIDTDQADECLPNAQQLPLVDTRALEAGKLLGGAVVLDVASPKGTIVLDLNLDGGWEFQYG